MSDEKAKVLMVHNYYQVGGGEHTVFENEVKLLRQHGHEVVTYTRDNAELKASKRKLALAPFSAIWSFKTYREVREILDKEAIDVVHCHNTFPLISPSVYYAAWKAGVPVVQTIHNYRFLCPNGLFYRDRKICEDCLRKGLHCALAHGCYRNSRIQTLPVVLMLAIHRLLGTYRRLNYIFLTDFTKRFFVEKFRLKEEQMFIKPNFIPDDSTPPRPLKCTKKSAPVFMFVGRLDEYKGVPFLISFWKKHRPGKLVIFGDGELRDFVTKNADGETIDYRGFQPQEVLRQEAQNATALIFPSQWYETYGLAVLESFSWGLPVVATNIGFHGQLVQDGVNGYKFRPRDEKSLLLALQKVQSDGEALRRSALDYYRNHMVSAEDNYQCLASIYARLITHSKEERL